MKNYYLKRISWGMLLHFLLGVMALLVAYVLVHSVITVEYQSECKTYQVDALEVSGIDFMDSDVFTDIFTNDALDVIHFVAASILLEDGSGEFRKERNFDVMEYSRSKGTIDDSTFSAYYSLDNLIKWGKQGFTSRIRYFGISDFMFYFGNTDVNFASSYEVEEYLDILVAAFPEEIAYVVDDDGIITITVSMLVCNYSNSKGQLEIAEMVDSWEDYFILKNNLIATCEDLAKEYDIYKWGTTHFNSGNSNLKYCVRVDDVYNYSNMLEYVDYSDDGLSEVVTENRQYLILFQEIMEYTTISEVSDQELYQCLRLYDYVFPDNTKIWMYVDSDFKAQGDVFSAAKTLFQDNLSHTRRIYIVGIFLLVGWIVLYLYLGMTTGMRINEKGEELFFLYWFDKIWVEIIGLLFVLGYFGFRYILLYLRNKASVSNILLTSIKEISSSQVWLFAQFFLFGFFVSLIIAALTFSLIRRYRAHVLFHVSFLHELNRLWHRMVERVGTNRNAVISTLIPYNLFIILNFLGAFLFALYIEKYPLQSSLVLLLLLIMDAIIGVRFFRLGMERGEIVEGASRIKAGEVDFRLDTENLEGMNLLLADAFNTIGEGIRNAVDTSMRDEQMKADLITNVSHDLKTPLTSIINYVNLLKKCDIQDEAALNYIKVLDDKSKRLKQLLEDLLEASKLSSGNVELSCERINLVELAGQSIVEFEDKLEEKKLQMIFEPKDNLYIYGDSRMLWRIMDNLLTNVCKYSMENTRVYWTIERIAGQKIQMELKNISQLKSKYQGAELTERFIRGDASRTTEGSGLGLFIARSLTNLQGGTFKVSMDGDLFKATMIFDEF